MINAPTNFKFSNFPSKIFSVQLCSRYTLKRKPDNPAALSTNQHPNPFGKIHSIKVLLWVLVLFFLSEWIGLQLIFARILQLISMRALLLSQLSNGEKSVPFLALKSGIKFSPVRAINLWLLKKGSVLEILGRPRPFKGYRKWKS